MRIKIRAYGKKFTELIFYSKKIVFMSFTILLLYKIDN